MSAMKTKAAPTTPNKEKTKPLFKQLVKRMSEREDFPALLKTSASEGWLTDGTFTSQMNETEHKLVLDLFGKHKASKKAEGKAVNIPAKVGYAIHSIKMSGKKALLRTAAGRVFSVDGELFAMLQKRHPNSQVYSSPDMDLIIFSERQAVATLTIIQVVTDKIEAMQESDRLAAASV